MTGNEVVLRARSAIGHGCVYKLGRGGMHGDALLPWAGDPFCDCSGFAMWALGLSRFQDPVWYDTTNIEHDATDGHRLFELVPYPSAKPGDLFVYGDYAGHQGHVGVVSEIGEAGPSRVIHCSLGNYRAYNDAIRETGPEIWIHHQGSLVARCLMVAWP